ncbi:MAG: hypothetical protein D6723_04555 [Acidobacteria bacterium]|nr:MAG: hypothetical protein D6723_04555 [Acidobacteriota bacterium]
MERKWTACAPHSLQKDGRLTPEERHIAGIAQVLGHHTEMLEDPGVLRASAVIFRRSWFCGFHRTDGREVARDSISRHMNESDVAQVGDSCYARWWRTWLRRRN